MKRKIITCILSLSLVFGNVAMAFATPIDVQRHWSATSVNTLLENKLMTGYENGRFKPDHAITREEVAAILFRLIETRGESSALKSTGAKAFSDAQGRWSTSAIEALASAGILNGYPDGTFHPADALSREAFATMISKYLDFTKQENEKLPELENTTDAGITTGAGISNDDSVITDAAITTSAGITTDAGITSNAAIATDTAIITDAGMAAGEDETPAQPKTLSFSDISGSYAADAIELLCADGILSGYEDGTFKPTNVISRAEAASVFYKASGFSPIAPVITLPNKIVIDVPYVSQVSPVSALVGCEGASMLMGLKGKGYATDVDLRQFLDGMPKHASNPAKGFAGSPYRPDPTKKTRTTIYPPVLAAYANQYGTVWDISGSSVHELRSEILAGNPVVAYVTMWWEKPFYRYYNIEGETQYLLSNNHVVLVCGYDDETKQYYIADPYNIKDTKNEYRYWIDAATFDSLYNVRRHALAVE